MEARNAIHNLQTVSRAVVENEIPMPKDPRLWQTVDTAAALGPDELVDTRNALQSDRLQIIDSRDS